MFGNETDISEDEFFELAGVSFDQLLEAVAITDGFDTLYCSNKSINPDTNKASIKFGSSGNNMGATLELSRNTEQKITYNLYEI